MSDGEDDFVSLLCYYRLTFHYYYLYNADYDDVDQVDALIGCDAIVVDAGDYGEDDYANDDDYCYDDYYWWQIAMMMWLTMLHYYFRLQLIVGDQVFSLIHLDKIEQHLVLPLLLVFQNREL